MPLDKECLPALTSRQRTVAIIFAFSLIALYFAGYFMHPNLPSNQAMSWWGWYDQGQYYRSVKALDQQNFDSNEYNYPIGYPLIGTLFYRVMPQHPFFIPNVICFMLICFSFVQICRRLVSFGEALALCFFGVVWPTTVFENLIIPWTNIPVHAALMFLVYLTLFHSPGFLRATLTGACAGIVFLCRPGDIVYTLPLIAALWIGSRRWHQVRSRISGFALTAVPIVGIGTFLSFAIHGHLLPQSYAKANLTIFGMGFSSLPIKLYSFLIDGYQLFGEKRTLVVVFPLLLVALPGFVAFVKELGWKGIAITLSQLGALAYYLAYNDYFISLALKYLEIRYWLWLIPFSTLYAYLTFRLAWRSLGRGWFAALLAIPIILWLTVSMEIQPVQADTLPTENSACAAQKSSTAGLLDDDETTGWRCQPGADGRCSFSAEFAKPVEFDFLKLQGTLQPLDVLYGELWLDGRRTREYKDYRDGQSPDGNVLLVFYSRQTAKSVRMVIIPKDTTRSLWISELQFSRRKWKLGLYSPVARYHPKIEQRLNADFLAVTVPQGFEEVTGFSGIESGSHTRWAESGESRLVFSLPAARPVQLLFNAVAPIAGQQMQVLTNAVQAASFRYAEAGQSAGARIRFAGKSGTNVITFRYSDWNHGRSTFASGDPRLMSVNFYALQVTELATPISALVVKPEIIPYGFDLKEGDVLFQPEPVVSISGVSAVEAAQSNFPRHRWALGPATRVTFSLPEQRCIGFETTFVSPDPRLVITIASNGKVLDQIKSPEIPLTRVTRRFLVDGRPGNNVLELSYSNWNHKDGKAFAPGDPREMAVDLLALQFMKP